MVSGKLSGINFNLLIAFQALIEERNVTHAAKKIHISQPAMSKNLQRLRELMGDQLFTRTSHGLIPTPFAESKAQELFVILNQMEQFIDGAGFSPESLDYKFTIASSDMFLGFFPSIVRAMAKSAPKAKLDIVELSEHYIDDLRDGRVDFAIHSPYHHPEELLSLSLVTGSTACYMRKSHPLADKDQLDVDDLLRFPHVRHTMPNISSYGLGTVDDPLIEMNKARDITVQTPFLLTAVDIVVNSDHLLITSEGIAHSALINSHLIAKEMPVELKRPLRDGFLLYHKRVESNPTHIWFREVISKIFSGKSRKDDRKESNEEKSGGDTNASRSH